MINNQITGREGDDRPDYGMQKKYRSVKSLSEAIEAYFRSISRTSELKEKIETGERDEKGKPIFEERDIKTTPVSR